MSSSFEVDVIYKDRMAARFFWAHAGGKHHVNPHAIGTVQIWVLNALSQEVLSRKPSQQFEYPIKGVLSSRTRKALEEKNQSDQQLANRRLKS